MLAHRMLEDAALRANILDWMAKPLVGFVGQTKRGPTPFTTRIDDVAEFLRVFG